MELRRDSRIDTVCLMLMATIVVAAALYWLKPIGVPFVLSILLSLAISPVIDLFSRFMPRAFALALTALVTFLVLFGLGAVIYSAAQQMVEINRQGDYQQQFSDLLSRLSEALPLERFGFEEGQVIDPRALIPRGTVQSMLLATSGALTDVLQKGLLVFIFVMFMLAGSQAGRPRPSGLWLEIEVRVKRYLVTKFVVSAITGILVWSSLAILGVKFATVFGLLAFLLNFIPSIGSIISTLLPLPVVVLAPDLGVAAKVLAIAIPGTIQFLVGNVVEPKVMGQSLDLHPVVILLALILWGMLWGIFGMLMAVPMTAVVKIAMERIEITRPVADLMAGRFGSLMRPESDPA